MASSYLPFLLLLLGYSFAQNASIVSVPQEYTYLLPDGFHGNSNYTFANGTHTSSNKINTILESAAKAPFISFDQSFLDILGSDPQIDFVTQRDNNFAYEAGVWVPELSEVWFTSAVSQAMVYPPTLYAMNLASHAIHKVKTTSPVTNPNGGYYFEGKVYIATYPNNETYSGGVIAIDVKTMNVETVVNSYFGLRFNGIDDLAWAKRGNDSYMFFTDLDFAYLGYNNLPPLQLPDGVWRWDPQNSVALPVIGRGDVNPNGVRVSPDMRTLYVTDTDATFAAGIGPSADSWLSPYVYAFDLNENMLPVNKRVFSLTRQGIADGLHIDDAGNVYTGEEQGVVVRNPAGKTIGIFNSQYFQEDKTVSGLAVANFALCGDILVFLSTNRLYTIKLGKTIVHSNSPIVN